MLCGYSYLPRFIFGVVKNSLKHKFFFSIFVYFFILVFLTLGVWQIVRLNWKLELLNSIENSFKSEPVEFLGSGPKNFQKITFEGKIDNSKIIYLYSLSETGEPGFDIINPVQINNKNFLLNRGWIPRGLKKNAFNINKKKFNGILRLKSKSNYFKPENDVNKNYWFTLKDDDLIKYVGLNFSPYIIYSQDTSNNQFPITKNIGANISNNHLKYALTWFSLAISIFLIYLYFRKKNY